MKSVEDPILKVLVPYFEADPLVNGLVETIPVAADAAPVVPVPPADFASVLNVTPFFTPDPPVDVPGVFFLLGVLSPDGTPPEAAPIPEAAPLLADNRVEVPPFGTPRSEAVPFIGLLEVAPELFLPPIAKGPAFPLYTPVRTRIN